MNLDTLTRSFRVTGFVDILGWASLTDGIDSRMLRRVKRAEDLSLPEREEVERLSNQVEVATRLDRAVRLILRQLQCFSIPERDVEGSPNAQRFWKNHHATFVRVSDSIFVHSSSYRTVVTVVSELLKRGLLHGIMFRAGISCGIVVHLEQDGSVELDPRTRDISMFGDGITTAVAAEKAGKGLGVRVLVHSRVRSLLSDPMDLSIVRACATQSPDVTDELCWWNDFANLYTDMEHIETCTHSTREWLESTACRLEVHQDYNWNRLSTRGRVPLQDTVTLLRNAITVDKRSSERLD
jgi:hypothetical protein